MSKSRSDKFVTDGGKGISFDPPKDAEPGYPSRDSEEKEKTPTAPIAGDSLPSKKAK